MRFAAEPARSYSDTWIDEDPLFVIPSQEYWLWSWYFLAGSEVQVGWNFQEPPNVYVIKGVQGYRHFRDGSQFDPSEILYESSSSENGFNVSILADDIYFFIFENWRSDASIVGGIYFNITTALYDVSDPLSTCHAPCSLTVPYQSNDFYILYTPTVTSQITHGKGSADSEFIFELRTSNRIWFVVLIPFVLPIGFYWLLLGSWLWCTRRGRAAHPHAPPAINLTIIVGDQVPLAAHGG